MSYLQLLVNLRSETALARVINVPDRGLDHRAFTAIKKEAKKTKLSMYQVSNGHVTYINKIPGYIRWCMRGLSSRGTVEKINYYCGTI